MAIKILNDQVDIEVISRLDEAVNCDDEAYNKYLETLDESLLNLDGEPTRFVVKLVLDYDTHRKLKNAQVKYSADPMSGGAGKISVDMAYMLTELRYVLKDIKNPGSEALTFKKDKDGYASKELVSILDQAGIGNDIITARANALSRRSSAKKN